MNKPKILYRFFKKKKYRDQFIRGLIRFGSLDTYKEIEDQRRDLDEGVPKGKYTTNKLMFLKINNVTGKVVDKGYKSGDINISGYSPNSFYIVSMSDDKADLEFLSKKFGKYAVKINDIEKLVNLVNQKCNIPWNVGKIKLAQVKYDKDKYITMEKNSPHLPVEYYFTQKSETYAHEFEWRIVLTGSAIDQSDEKFVVIKVGSLHEIVSRVDF